MVLRRLCMLLGPDKCFLELAARLTDQTNLKYASTMVQVGRPPAAPGRYQARLLVFFWVLPPRNSVEGSDERRAAAATAQALNLILLTAPETKELRHMLQRSQDTPAGRQLFLALYKSWAHSPGALLTLCFLAQVPSLPSPARTTTAETSAVQ